MRMWTGLALALSIAACSVPSSPQPSELFSGEIALQLVAVQMDFGPRVPGSPAHQATGDWILDQLQQAGWETDAQTFEVEGLHLRNLIGRAGPASGEPYLLGAHYDTRPFADRDPAFPDRPVPGANDGASGVAVLLELARVLDTQRLPQPVWLVFFDGEDGGGLAGRDWLLGSRYFAHHLTAHPAAVVVVDMVGDADLGLYFEQNSDLALASAIWATANQLGYQAFIPFPKYAIYDDHVPFLELGIPAVDIIDFDYPHWHTTQDTLDKVSAGSFEQVGRTLQTWLGTIR
ncbi:MAG: M28 family peptidase [Chloroflexota bacterium]